MRARVKFLGLYGPRNDRWNWVYMFNVESHDRLVEVTGKIDKQYGGRPKQVTNLVWKVYRKNEPE